MSDFEETTGSRSLSMNHTLWYPFSREVGKCFNQLSILEQDVASAMAVENLNAGVVSWKGQTFREGVDVRFDAVYVDGRL